MDGRTGGRKVNVGYTSGQTNGQLPEWSMYDDSTTRAVLNNHLAFASGPNGGLHSYSVFG